LGTSRQIPPAADLLRTPPQDPQGGADPHAGLGQSLHRLRERIDAAQALHGRAPGSVALLAVSKAFPAATVAAAAAHGQHAFGENYVQEAVAKIAALRADAPAVPLEWHFIGPIQSNKTRAIAAHFDWVQSVERVEIARRLSAQRPAHLPPLQVLLQVNIDAEPSKSGVAPEALDALAQAVASLPRLRLRGLMAIPRASGVAQEQRAGFARMRALFERTGARLAALAQPGHADGDPTACWDTLSMGMSADFELAIAEGSTLVRVGSALFGERP
jgi:pyridoxal phosphate enzyme (YggS family)